MSRPRRRDRKEERGPRLHNYAREQLAIWDALRRLGFAADDIYAAFYNGNELFTTLKAGGKEWNISISNGRKLEPERYISLYTAKCEWWNKESSKEERREIFEKYMPVEKMISMAMSIRAKGIDIPRIPDAPSPEAVAELMNFMGAGHDDDEDGVQGFVN
jgi:hypothetical protein